MNLHIKQNKVAAVKTAAAAMQTAPHVGMAGTRVPGHRARCCRCSPPTPEGQRWNTLGMQAPRSCRVRCGRCSPEITQQRKGGTAALWLQAPGVAAGSRTIAAAAAPYLRQSQQRNGSRMGNRKAVPVLIREQTLASELEQRIRSGASSWRRRRQQRRQRRRQQRVWRHFRGGDNSVSTVHVVLVEKYM
jgi:hypothetical protein